MPSVRWTDGTNGNRLTILAEMVIITNDYTKKDEILMTNEERKQELQKRRLEQKDFPIIRVETQKLIENIVQKRKPQMVLELGSGKGYSGSVMLTADDSVNLLTIEKDKDNYTDAMRMYAELDFFERVLPINADAEEVVEKLVGSKTGQKFDLILLDCNKSSYNRMFENVVELLSPGGVLIADDCLYHGKVLGEGEIPKKKHRTIVVNMREFIDKVQNSDKLENVTIYDFEDGVLVATKK